MSLGPISLEAVSKAHRDGFPKVTEYVGEFSYIRDMEHVDDIIDRFSSYLFWDVDKSTLDMRAHASYIIKRVLEYGQLPDWNIH